MISTSSTIFILLLFCAVSTSTTNDCPSKCKCTHTSFSTQRVDCSGLGLSQLPSEIPRNTEVLDLRRNYFYKLDVDKLVDLTKLHTLFLTDNKIRHIDENVFDLIPMLERVYMGRNQLRSIPVLSSRGSSHLHVLDLHSNHLRHIDQNAFSKLFHLEKVNLAKNYLQSLPAHLFSSNPLLVSLRLGHNPWNCDCRIIPTINLLKSKPLLQNHGHEMLTSKAQCQNPGTRRFSAIHELSVDEVMCFQASAFKSENSFQLTCRLEGAANVSVMELSASNVQWLYQDAPLSQNLSGEYELLNNGSLLIFNSQLDTDKFQCAFNYVLSPSRQTRHTLPVYKDQQYEGPPQFTYVLRERSFREGSAVKLNCEVVGKPRPKISWAFNGQPVELSRKYQFGSDNTELIIYPFLEHDIGSYTCEAVNIHGKIESTATIGLIRSSPPVIVEGPKATTVKVGQQAKFVCKARGEPKPAITWFFDGSEIPPELKRHYWVSDDGSELTLENAGRQDQGSFSCMAGNPVGSMTADAMLTVQQSQLDGLDRQLNSQLLKNIVNQASENVDRAILKTEEDFKQVITSPHNLLRHFKFAAKKPVELARAREIYEESLRLIEKHVDLGLQLRPTEMPTNISYESVLSVTHIQTIMELSGCMNGQFKDSCSNMCFHSKYRSYTGQCNNFEHPTWGVSQMPFHRLLPPIYENGFNTPVGWNPRKLYFGYSKPNPRTVSMELIGTEKVTPHHRFSSMMMQWGQFLDHDLDFTATALARQTYTGGAFCNRTCENVDPCFNIPLPLNDERRKTPHGMKFPCIEFERSAAICGSGETSPIFKQVTYREQTNIITSYIDGSNIYGSTEVDAIDLRDLFSDHGLLRFDIVSSAQKPYMPFEKDSAMDCRRNFSLENPIRCFLSGDFRANEQLGLTSMHTIWFREHNRIASKLLEMNADWDGERIYQEARKIIGAMLQHITYTHWLPKVLGQDGYDRLVGKYMGYDSQVNPSISNAFATAAFRFGHTLINPKLERLDENFASIAAGPLPLHEAFFAPERLLSEGGIDPLLRGLFASPLKQPMTSQLLNKELTERLFHRAHNISLDLAVMNIQRGRDHALPGYLEYRRFCNFTVPTSWSEMAMDVEDSNVLNKLKILYGHPGNIDLWVGGIVEKRFPDALIGPTFSCIIGDQFGRLRSGDRFWYENPGTFTPLQLMELKKTSLAKVLCNNGDAIHRVQTDVFLYTNNNKLLYKKCEDITDINLNMWMSCCDETCSANPNAELTDEKSRSRRSHHLYAPLKTADGFKNGCSWNGTLFKEHSEWYSEKCVLCKCQDEKVWCTSVNNCSD